MSGRAELLARVAALPRQPGVYQFRDGSGEVLYVGKARSLRERVRSYFREGGDGRPLVRFIEERVADVEVIVTRSEKEAFLLENNLIKQRKPRFNIRLRDDKTWLHLRIDRSHPFPAIVPYRRPRKDGALYFGPYDSARAIRTTLRLLRSVFPLRDCSDHEFANRTRPCLQHQIHMCSAPCVDLVSEQEYGRQLEGALDVLRGSTAGLAEELDHQMEEASRSLEFERAAVLRDRIAFLRRSTEEQVVEVSRAIDRDVIGRTRRGARVELSVLQIRAGKMVAAHPYSFETDLPDDEALSMFLSQYYRAGRPLPDEVLLPAPAYGAETLAELLGEQRGRPLKIRVPRGGEAARSVAMACRNAELAQEAARDEEGAQERILAELRQLLDLPVLPRVIECVDVSHLQGAQAVASLVRFEAGEPDRAGYRRYRIREAAGNDDYGAMREVLLRRIGGARKRAERLPDLLLLDGGRGQLSVARAVCEELGPPFPALAGIAKAQRRGRGIRLAAGEEERVYLPGRSAPVVLAPDSEACYLLQRVRDEAHRFALAYHRRLRSRASSKSVLEDVPGLGPARARGLLHHFGGWRSLRAASEEDLAAAPGIGPVLAARVYQGLHPQ